MKETIKDIITEVLSRLEEHNPKIKLTSEARSLIYETGMVESGYRHLKQMGDGPALSFFQIEKNTIDDIWKNYMVYRPKLIELAYSLGYIEKDPYFSVMSNIAVAVLFCRIYYYRKPGAIPKAKGERAQYWKSQYNTAGGKGTVGKYMEANA